MIQYWGVVQDGKLLTVWGYEYQARRSAIGHKGAHVVSWLHKVGGIRHEAR